MNMVDFGISLRRARMMMTYIPKALPHNLGLIQIFITGHELYLNLKIKTRRIGQNLRRLINIQTRILYTAAKSMADAATPLWQNPRGREQHQSPAVPLFLSRAIQVVLNNYESGVSSFGTVFGYL